MVLTTAPASAEHDVVQHVEMLAHEIEGDEIADPFVELGRTLEIGEQEGQARDLQPLISVERVGAVDVAESLVGQQSLGGQERLAFAQEIMQRMAGNPETRQHAAVGFIIEREPQRPGAHFHGSSRCLHIVEDERELLALARRLTLHVDELRAVRDRIEHDHEVGRQLHRKQRLLPGREFDRTRS